MELKELIPLLRSCGVRRFRDKELEIEFDSAEFKGSPDKAPQETSAASPSQSPTEAPDLTGTSEVMTAEQILNWSASPDVSESEAMPMTGDKPLEAPAVGVEP